MRKTLSWALTTFFTFAFLHGQVAFTAFDIFQVFGKPMDSPEVRALIKRQGPATVTENIEAGYDHTFASGLVLWEFNGLVDCASYSPFLIPFRGPFEIHPSNRASYSDDYLTGIYLYYLSDPDTVLAVDFPGQIMFVAPQPCLYEGPDLSSFDLAALQQGKRESTEKFLARILPEEHRLHALLRENYQRHMHAMDAQSPRLELALTTTMIGDITPTYVDQGFIWRLKGYASIYLKIPSGQENFWMANIAKATLHCCRSHDFCHYYENEWMVTSVTVDGVEYVVTGSYNP